MPALTPDATRLLHHLTRHNTSDGTPIHYLNHGTWALHTRTGPTTPDTALIELKTADCIRYLPGVGLRIEVTHTGHQHAA